MLTLPTNYGKLNFVVIMEPKECFSVRVKVTLACTDCKERNYDTTKNKRTTPNRIELKKYCFRCGTHTLHRETK